MAYATKLTFLSNCYFVISSVLNLDLIVKLLMEDVVLDYQPSKKSKNLIVINLYFYKIKSIIAKDLLNLY